MHAVEVLFHRGPAEGGNMLGRGDDEPIVVGIARSEDPTWIEWFDRQRDKIGECRHGLVERRLDDVGQGAPRGEPRRNVQTTWTSRPSGEWAGERSRITGSSPGLHGEQESQVRYRRRERVIGGIVDPVRDGSPGDYAVGGFDAYQPAEGRRNPDGASAVGRGGEGGEAGSQRRAR